MSVLPDRVEWLEVFYMLEQTMSMVDSNRRKSELNKARLNLTEYDVKFVLTARRVRGRIRFDRFVRDESITDVHQGVDLYVIRHQLVAEAIDVNMQALRIEGFFLSPGRPPQLLRGDHSFNRAHQARDEQKLSARQVDGLAGALDVVVTMLHAQITVIVDIFRLNLDVRLGRFDC
jgi:hypothetical protein